MDTRVVDAGDLRKYRTEIPNLVDDMDLSVYAFRLYVHLKRVAGQEGACFQGTRGLAERCRMSVGSVSKAKQELVDKGLIYVEERGRNESDLITIADIWRANYDTFAPSGDKLSPVQQANTPVHNVNTSVHTVNTPVHDVNERSNSLKKEPIKNEPTRKAEAEAAAPPAPPLAQHRSLANDPAVAIYLKRIAEVTKQLPNRYQMQLIADTVTDMALWEGAVCAWLARNYKPLRVDGMLEWYADPTRFQNPYPKGQNCYANRQPSREPVAEPPAQLDPAIVAAFAEHRARLAAAQGH